MKSYKINFIYSVGNQTGCQHTICELHLSNYTRYDPKVIECIADNEKSTRISKVFYVDVFCKFSNSLECNS